MSLFSLLRHGSAGLAEASYDSPGGTSLAADVDSLIALGRYCRVLDRDQDEVLDERSLALAWLALERDMAFVPAPDLGTDDVDRENTSPPLIPSIYLDRYAVTNEQFSRFVSDDGYSQMDLWPHSIWPNLLQFVDSTGHPGPRFWRHGRVPESGERHPVVGVNWFEARAYARWCGKRLPTAAEWEHAGSWFGGRDGRTHRSKYPWGDTFDPRRANTWTGGRGETVRVDQYDRGATPNGIYQLIGNVWEWVATQYEYTPKDTSLRVAFEEPMVEIRGGAFDTYFETQATCQFRTGQPFLYRGSNVGFRCCLPGDQLSDPPPPTAFG